MALPYLPVTAVALLISGQLLFGDGPDGVEVFVGVLVIFLVLARQLLSLMDNRLLLRRVYEGQQQLAHQALHDPLTGLANRTFFAVRLEQVMRGVGDDALRLIFVDLDGFKEVNDPFGHAYGDLLLHAVADRLPLPRAADTVARLGGDEFAILLEGEIDAPQAVADRIRDALRRPFAVHGTELPSARAWAWWSWIPTEPLVTSDVLLGRADTSMYAGKRLGKDTTVVYRPSQDGPPDFTVALRTRRAACRTASPWSSSRSCGSATRPRSRWRRWPGGPRRTTPQILRPTRSSGRRKAPGSVPSWTRWRSTWRAARSPPPSWS